MNPNNTSAASPRWFALIKDRIFTTPRAVVPVSLLRAFAGVVSSDALVRDHVTPNDEPLDDNGTVDLSKGNVFVTKPRGSAGHGGRAHGPAKMALALDDHFELTPLAEMNLTVFLSLFNAPAGTAIVRDFESPHDQPIQPGDVIRFADGPTFLSQGGGARHVDVSIVTTSGAFPAEGFERLPSGQVLKVQLARAVAALRLGDTSDWIARHGSRELNIEQSYTANQLTGCVEIDYGKREGGGGSRS